MSSWWLNQPIWKICKSQIGPFPQFSGWKWKKFELPSPSIITPPKTNMEPENDVSQKDSPFPGVYVEVPC